MGILYCLSSVFTVHQELLLQGQKLLAQGQILQQELTSRVKGSPKQTQLEPKHDARTVEQEGRRRILIAGEHKQLQILS